MCEQTLPRQAEVFWLQQCTVLVSAVLTFGMLGFPTARHFSTCNATLFLSFEVRGCCDSAVEFTGKKVVSDVVIFQIEVARDFYMTQQRISAFCGVCRLLKFSGAREELPPTRFGCLHRRAESNFRFVPVAQTECPSTSRRPSLKKSLSSSIIPCASALFNVRNRAFRTSDCM